MNCKIELLCNFLQMSADKKITDAYADYADNPSGRAADLCGMPQTCDRLLSGFFTDPDALIVFIPSTMPFASPNSCMLPRLLAAYLPFIDKYSIKSLLDTENESLGTLQDDYLESVYGDPDYDAPEYDVTKLPKETKDEIDNWVKYGGELCGHRLLPPVDRLVAWLGSVGEPDDEHPYFCDCCRSFTTNLQTVSCNDRKACYLCMACSDCGTCHSSCCDSCSYNEVALAAINSIQLPLAAAGR